MGALVLAGVLLMPLAMIGVWAGVRVSLVLREQFEELMPQRMVDYAGFVKLPLGRD
jgi:hypothetical protein